MFPVSCSRKEYVDTRFGTYGAKSWPVKTPSRDYPVVRTPQFPSLVRKLRFPHVSQPKKKKKKKNSFQILQLDKVFPELEFT